MLDLLCVRPAPGSGDTEAETKTCLGELSLSRGSKSANNQEAGEWMPCHSWVGCAGSPHGCGGEEASRPAFPYNKQGRTIEVWFPVLGFFPSSNPNRAIASREAWFVTSQTERELFLFFKISREELSATFWECPRYSPMYTESSSASITRTRELQLKLLSLAPALLASQSPGSMFLHMGSRPPPFFFSRLGNCPSHPGLVLHLLSMISVSRPGLTPNPPIPSQLQNADRTRRGVCWARAFPSQFLQIPESPPRLVKWVSLYMITKRDSGMTARGKRWGRIKHSPYRFN